ncbi:HSFY1 protein, partial [Aegotheles bennettii]|nr:HSFY1 protein [Aegotheles bennettii]
LSFLKQLWKITCSEEFQSIWWVDDGAFVAINEEMFETEVLARRGPRRVFELDSIESFHHHLDLHGLHELPAVSDSLDSEDEAAAPAPRKLLRFYYNSNFKRDHPQLLARCKPRVGRKRKAPAASRLDAELEESCPSGS